MLFQCLSVDQKHARMLLRTRTEKHMVTPAPFFAGGGPHAFSLDCFTFPGCAASASRGLCARRPTLVVDVERHLRDGLCGHCYRQSHRARRVRVGHRGLRQFPHSHDVERSLSGQRHDGGVDSPWGCAENGISLQLPPPGSEVGSILIGGTAFHTAAPMARGASAGRIWLAAAAPASSA